MVTESELACRKRNTEGRERRRKEKRKSNSSGYPIIDHVRYPGMSLYHAMSFHTLDAHQPAVG